ncbi:hypothetical protein YerA41_072 [Yersinia phage YerA41]|nr:hypothetical protein YerA41_072 [Yersinia phage YerA41]
MIKVGLAKNCTHFCGRPKSYKPFYGKDFSILGNPYFMKDESFRMEVCDKYDIHFHSKMLNDPAFRHAVMEIVVAVMNGEDVILGCFCYPRRCHCDTIVKYVLKLVG